MFDLFFPMIIACYFSEPRFLRDSLKRRGSPFPCSSLPSPSQPDHPLFPHRPTNWQRSGKPTMRPLGLRRRPKRQGQCERWQLLDGRGQLLAAGLGTSSPEDSGLVADWSPRVSSVFILLLPVPAPASFHALWLGPWAVLASLGWNSAGGWAEKRPLCPA